MLVAMGRPSFFVVSNYHLTSCLDEGLIRTGFFWGSQFHFSTSNHAAHKMIQVAGDG